MGRKFFKWLIIIVIVVGIVVLAGFLAKSFLLSPENEVEKNAPHSEPSNEMGEEQTQAAPPSASAPENAEDVTLTNTSQAALQDIYSLIAFTTMLFVTIISIATSYYFYRKRRLLLLQDPSLRIPEANVDALISVVDRLGKLEGQISQSLDKFEGKLGNNEKNIDVMKDISMDMHKALDEKDAEIKRLNEGYDAEIFRRFIARFARIEQALEDFANENPESDEYRQLQYLFADAFDECGVTKYFPALGEDCRQTDGIAEHPKTIPTDNPKQDFEIAEVIESGYRLKTGGSGGVIKLAKVKIYKFSRKE